MALINRTPTTRYFVTMFVVVSSLFFVFSGVVYHNYQQAQELNRWTLYNYELARQSRKILFDLVDMETGVRGYLLTGRKHFLKPYRESQASLKKQIDLLRKYTAHDTSTQNSIDVWLKSIEAFNKTLDTQVENYNNSLWRSTTNAQMESQKRQMDQLRAMLETFTQKRLDDLSLRLSQAKSAEQDFKLILAIGTALAIGGMLLTTLLILSLIRRNQVAENDVRTQEDRFKTVMLGLNDGVYDLNLVTNTIYYSDSYKSMLGYADDELENTVAASINQIHPDDVGLTQQTLQKYIHGESDHYTNVFRMLHKDGSWRWILSRGVGLKDARGKMTRLIGTHTDITAHKKREEELALVNSEMETFTYITSHDLRAPLVNLRGFASEMGHAIKKITPIIQHALDKFSPQERNILEDTLESDVPESLRFIEQSVAKMDALTTAVLDLSRIGSRQYRVERVDVQTIVQRCFDMLAYEMAQKKITVTCDELPIIFNDAVAVEQVFSNVLDNAVKYLSPERPGKIHVGVRTTFNEVIFSIADNGRGIATDDNEKVFQVFRRARNSQDVRGTGMGMAFVQATVRRLGGNIWFKSTLNEGTVFFIQLPKKIALKGVPHA